MELRQIRYFVAVAEQLHFGRAAELLNVGQPGVSQQIARLERELRVQLFDRSSRMVRLTQAGQRFLPSARAVLVAVERAEAAAAGPDRGAGERLRLGTSTGLGVRLDDVLAALRRTTPDVQVQLVSAPTRVRLSRVRAGQLDAAFVRGLTSAPGLELIELWHDPLVAVLPASHPLADRTAIELSDLAAMPLRIVSRSLNQPLVDLVTSACEDRGFEPLLGPRSQSLQDTLAAIGTGPPAWTVLYAAHAQSLHLTRVVFRPFVAPGLAMTTTLAVSPAATSRSLAPLLRACSEIASGDWSP